MTIHSAFIHRAAGHWHNENATGTLTLDFDSRHRRRIRLTTDHGEDMFLHLPEAIAMANGDGVQLDDGRWLMIQAAAETIIEVTHTDPSQLIRLAWHLGNRHLPTETRPAALRIRPDHVIEEMLSGFGATLRTIEAPFQPEGGAYGNHNHHHSHDES